MDMNQAQKTQQFWIKPVLTLEQKQALKELRQRIYHQSGKTAESTAYESPMDQFGQAYFICSSDKVIGTFSVSLLGQSSSAREHLSQQLEIPSDQFEESLYIYFLGIDREERRASVVKFVFGEIFKILVRNKLADIYVLADARLTQRYRWIGFVPTHQRVLSSFPKSGWLTLLRTNQKRLGIYGLHADPVRWNWYLRSSVSALLAEGSLPHPRSSRVIYFVYSLFAPLALVVEKIAGLVLRRGKENFSLQRRI